MRGKPNGAQNLAAMKHGDLPAFVARLRVFTDMFRQFSDAVASS
jgi:hypothetical protein